MTCDAPNQWLQHADLPPDFIDKTALQNRVLVVPGQDLARCNLKLESMAKSEVFFVMMVESHCDVRRVTVRSAVSFEKLLSAAENYCSDASGFSPGQVDLMP